MARIIIGEGTWADIRAKINAMYQELMLATATTTTIAPTTTAVLNVYTDNFDSYADTANLGSQTNWGTEDGAIKIAKPVADGKITSNDAGYSSCYHKGTFSTDHYSEIVTSGSSDDYVGVTVRNKGDGSGNYYAYMQSNNYRKFWRVVNGSATQLGTASAGAAGTLELRVVGTTISCYYNGSLDTSLTGGTGQFTDATHSTGTPGVGTDLLLDGNRRGDTWEGGDL